MNTHPVDWLIDCLRDIAEDRGWIEDDRPFGQGSYPGYTEVTIDRSMTLDDLDALASGLNARLDLDANQETP